MTQEQWRPILDYEGIYEVSNLGRVRSLSRYRSNGRQLSGRVLRPGRIGRGYRVVSLCYDGEGQTRRIHRLVLEAFVSPCPEGKECAHLDGDPSNNQLENLAWVTEKENSHHRIKHGTGGWKLTVKRVRKIRRLYRKMPGRKCERYGKLAEQFAVCPEQIRCVVLRRSWKAV